MNNVPIAHSNQAKSKSPIGITWGDRAKWGSLGVDVGLVVADKDDGVQGIGILITSSMDILDEYERFAIMLCTLTTLAGCGGRRPAA